MELLERFIENTYKYYIDTIFNLFAIWYPNEQLGQEVL